MGGEAMLVATLPFVCSQLAVTVGAAAVGRWRGRGRRRKRLGPARVRTT